MIFRHLRNTKPHLSEKVEMNSAPLMIMMGLAARSQGAGRLGILPTHPPMHGMGPMPMGPIPMGPEGPGEGALSFTPEQREAIERLCELGFDPGLVMQVYVACDHDEQAAANLLMSMGD
jgi:hypothetical protein